MPTFKPIALVALIFAGSAAFAELPGSYMDDTAISTKIKASLVKDQELKAFDIHVNTDHGTVHLTGNVDTSLQKADAERIAKTTENVKDVVDDIVIAKK